VSRSSSAPARRTQAPAGTPELLPEPKPSDKQAPAETPPARPAPGGDRMPIDLPTALRLADASNPTIGFAQARMREAQARAESAAVLWLPNLALGASYYRLDGQTQNQRGEMFTVSRQTFYPGVMAAMNYRTADALFAPLVARRLADAAALQARSVRNNISLDVALAYLDLVQVIGQLAINADTLARAEQMLEGARAADKVGLSKTKADLNRAETEVSLRRQERIELRGRAGVASARLTRLLLLDPAVELAPAEPTVVPVTLVSPDAPLNDLIAVAVRRRPELAANRAAVGAAEAGTAQAAAQPLLPRFQVDYTAGAFGGGRNSEFNNFNSRGVGNAALFWEFNNLGLGNVAQVKERAAVVEQGNYRGVELRAQVAAEVVEAVKVALARRDALDDAEAAVREAVEMYRKLLDTQFGMVGPRPQYDSLEPLIAIQMLNQARLQYLLQVVEYNRAQFRLFWAMGQPVFCGLPGAAEPLDVRTVPDRPGFTPEPPKKGGKEPEKLSQ
jgi:outer membrane protein TolC